MNFLLKASTLLLVSVFTFACVGTKAQTRQDLAKLDKKHQTCLDKGSVIMNCTQTYYTEVDSFLKVVYNQLSESLNQSQKTALTTEQLQWEKQRDAYFKQVDLKIAAENNIGNNRNDSRMMALHEKALYVRKRVDQLLSRLQK